MINKKTAILTLSLLTILGTGTFAYKEQLFSKDKTEGLNPIVIETKGIAGSGYTLELTKEQESLLEKNGTITLSDGSIVGIANNKNIATNDTESSISKEYKLELTKEQESLLEKNGTITLSDGSIVGIAKTEIKK